MQQYFATHPSTPIPQRRIDRTLTSFQAVQRQVGPAVADRRLQWLAEKSVKARRVEVFA
ncbi:MULTISPECIES: hypothetical protein [Streptomyces]|uniref:Uncharacterized protein n=2 Tax=Streptomyces TaxID=1883 RepID=A0ABV9IWY6_9ACTN